MKPTTGDTAAKGTIGHARGRGGHLHLKGDTGGPTPLADVEHGPKLYKLIR